MNKHYPSLILLLLFIFVSLLPPPVWAEPFTEEEQQILEQSLSIKEIDREIARIEARQEETETAIRQLAGQLAEKNEQIRSSREQAGARIRAYYMGERENLFAALLSVGSLKDFFIVLDYYQLILERDHIVLDKYKSEHADLVHTKQELEAVSDDLARMKAELQLQRERVAALQQQVDQSLGLSADPEKLKAMIEELMAYWENVGLYELRKYFTALSAAMSEFPDFLNDYKDSLTAEKGGYSLTVRQEELNEFLHRKNELLKDISFTFLENQITVQGSQEQLKLKVEGHYTVEHEPENSITFHVDRLLFNGLELPDTTRAELERDFDLGFYPKKIVPFVEATEVMIARGTLVVKLKLSF